MEDVQAATEARATLVLPGRPPNLSDKGGLEARDAPGEGAGPWGAELFAPQADYAEETAAARGK